MNKDKPVDKIIEGNILIAEFVGGKLKHYNLSNEPYYQLNKQQWMPERLIYHTSWDWLMPVVEKIKISDEWGWEHPTTLLHYDLHHSLINLDLKSLWVAVGEFIHWYNQTQNK